MLTWGRRWLDPVPSDTQLTHQRCGKKVKAVFRCASCGDAITRDGIELS